MIFFFFIFEKRKNWTSNLIYYNNFHINFFNIRNDFNFTDLLILLNSFDENIILNTVIHKFIFQINIIDSFKDFKSSKNEFNLNFINQSDCFSNSNQLSDSGIGWINIDLCLIKSENDILIDLSQIVYEWVLKITDYSLDNPSRITLDNLNNKIILYSSINPNISEQILKIIPNISIQYSFFNESDFSIICNTCKSTNCIFEWIQLLPEFQNSMNLNFLPIFLLPLTCPYQYSSNNLIFFPIGNDISLNYTLKKTFYGFESLYIFESFYDIIIKRNILCSSLKFYHDNLNIILNEIFNLYEINNKLISSKFLTIFFKNFYNYSYYENKILNNSLNSDINLLLNDFNQLKIIFNTIKFIWNQNKPSIKSYRKCLGSFKKLNDKNIWISIPTYLFLFSLIISIFLLIYVYQNNDFLDVFKFLNNFEELFEKSDRLYESFN